MRSKTYQPGTALTVGNHSVIVDRYISEGNYAPHFKY